MSIAQRNEIEDLKRRVAELEKIVVVRNLGTGEVIEVPVPKSESKTLTLPEKRKSA